MKLAQDYAESQDRRRWVLSILLTVALYLLAGGVAFVVNLLSPPEELVLSNKTVVVDLQGPIKEKSGRGSIYPSDVGEEGETVALPSAASAQPSASNSAKTAPKTAAPVSKPAAPKPAAPKAATEKPAPTPQSQPVQEKRTSPLDLVSAVEETKPSTEKETTQTAQKPAATTQPAEALSTAPQAQASGQTATQAEEEQPWSPSGPRSSKSGQTGANQFLYVPGQGMVLWGEGNSYIVRKAERGSGIETAFGGAKGTVGHNLYVPVSDSMPVPESIPASIYDKGAVKQSAETAAQRKRDFLTYYELKGDTYVLKKPVPLEKRGLIWPILDDGKYDMTKADYKQDKNLTPVIIGFTITKDNQLKDVQILQSSGYPDLDRAVEYGFKRASFWNKTGETVPGKFTYYF